MKSTNPLVSVFMPVYNAEKYIEEAVESVVNQDYNNIELIISDDSSTDNSQILLRELQSKYPEVIKLYLQEKNLGVTGNCNFLLTMCKGEFICFTAGDDILCNNSISVSVEEIQQNEELAIVFHKNIKIDKYSNLLEVKEINRNTHIGNIFDFLKKGIYIQSNGMLVRASAIPKAGYSTRLRLASDFDFILQILGDKYSFLYINRTLSKYRKHSESITIKKAVDCSFDDLEALLILIRRYPEYTHFLTKQISNKFRGLRKINDKVDYKIMLKASLSFNILNWKSLIAYCVYYMSFLKIKV